nr:MAG TPA: hypothetical protein [Caudoviricetes sp.]
MLGSWKGFIGVWGIGGVKQGLRHEKHRIIPPPPPKVRPENESIPYRCRCTCVCANILLIIVCLFL